jgi:hypothetical protein
MGDGSAPGPMGPSWRPRWGTLTRFDLDRLHGSPLRRLSSRSGLRPNASSNDRGSVAAKACSLVALVRAGARFDKGVMVERPDDAQEVAA